MEYQYVAYDGTVYNYFLDEEGSPYIIVNEEIVYILLPLEHLRVTDPEKLAELNETILNPEMIRSEPSNYYDISNNNSTTDIDSPKYSTDVNFNNITTFTTPVLKVNRQHATIRFKTSNLAVGQKVNFTVYYYDSVFDEWYSDSYTNKDCTSLRGFGIQFSPTVTPYLQLILCISLLILPLVIVWFDYILPRGISGNFLFLSGRITMGLFFQTAYLCVFPFFVFYAIKAFIIWIINKRKPFIKEPLKEFDIHSKEPLNPEPSYAIEEEKLTRVLSQYYKNRNQMEQLRRDLINNDLDMTPMELREELDKIIYFQEIIPSNPFTTEYRVKTKMVTIIICIIAIIVWVKSYQISNNVMEDYEKYMQEDQNEGSISL